MPTIDDAPPPVPIPMSSRCLASRWDHARMLGQQSFSPVADPSRPGITASETTPLPIFLSLAHGEDILEVEPHRFATIDAWGFWDRRDGVT